MRESNCNNVVVEGYMNFLALAGELLCPGPFLSSLGYIQARIADLFGYNFCGFSLVAYAGISRRALLILIIALVHPHPGGYGPHPGFPK